MYKKVIRPILFLIPPEIIHRIIVTALRVIHYIPGSRMLLRAFCAVRHPSLEREVFGIRFQNPVGIAAGFDKDAEVYKELLSLGFGFTEIGTVTPKAQPGNPRPRLFRLPEDNALINRMGFNNQGMENAVRNLRHRRPHQIIGGNLGKNTQTRNEDAPADYLRLFRNLYQYVDYFIINVSCPNVANLTSLQDKNNLNLILRGLIDFRRGQNQYRPILLKISPDLTDAQIDDMIDVLVETGLDGIVATNTTTRRDGLETDPATVAAIGNGGLSGGPLTRRSLPDHRRGRHHDRGRRRSDAERRRQPDPDLYRLYLQRSAIRQTYLQATEAGSREQDENGNPIGIRTTLIPTVCETFRSKRRNVSIYDERSGNRFRKNAGRKRPPETRRRAKSGRSGAGNAARRSFTAAGDSGNLSKKSADPQSRPQRSERIYR